MSVNRVIQGDLFESQAQTLVNTVNTVGVMGKGIALAFKRRYPAMFEDYRVRCDRGEVKLGEPYIYRSPNGPPWIINFPTKGHWRTPSKLSDIEHGLRYLVDHAHEWGIESLAVPPLGCGNGELEWRVVGPVIYEHLDQLDIPVVMYAPFGTPLVQLETGFLHEQLELLHDYEEQPPPEFKVQPAIAALVAVLDRLSRNPLSPPVGRISFHKLAYFGTEAGLPTGLRFDQGNFGPYAADLKQVVVRLINNSLIEENAQGNMIRVQVGSAFEHAQGNFAEAFKQWNEPIARLVDLFSRMDTRDAEVAATVHYTAKRLNEEHQVVTELDVFNYVQNWKPEKFSREDVATAIRNLALLGWLEVRPSKKLPLPQDAVGALV